MRAQRELVALVAIPTLAATIIWLPPWVFLAVLGAAAVLACDEFLKMARAAGHAAGHWLPLGLIGGMLAASWIYGVIGLAVAVKVSEGCRPRPSPCCISVSPLRVSVGYGCCPAIPPA